MKRQSDFQAENFIRERKRHTWLRRTIALLCAIVILLTMNSLKMNADTLEHIPGCGLEEHRHTLECYPLICPLVEAEPQYEIRRVFTGDLHPHVHTEDCYDDNGILACGYAEGLYYHVHNRWCYDDDGNLVCGLNEIRPHVHTAACYQDVPILICGQDEYPAHHHTQDCYFTVRELACGLEENPGHIHTDECYYDHNELTCGLEESVGHVHTSECYIPVVETTCGQEEGPGHIHTAECYTRELICGEFESDEHQHTDECYADVLTCEIPEGYGAHTHTESCYTVYNILVCGIPEGEGAHRHTKDCVTSYHTLICGIPEGEGAHTHTDNCYINYDYLVCGQEETEGHTHTDECYEHTTEMICGEQDSSEWASMMLGQEGVQVHDHTDECFTTFIRTLENGEERELRFATCGYLEIPTLTCQESDWTGYPVLVSEGHTHTAECYDLNAEPVCGMVEHEHTDACYQTRPVKAEAPAEGENGDADSADLTSLLEDTGSENGENETDDLPGDPDAEINADGASDEAEIQTPVDNDENETETLEQTEVRNDEQAGIEGGDADVSVPADADSSAGGESSDNEGDAAADIDLADTADGEPSDETVDAPADGGPSDETADNETADAGATDGDGEIADTPADGEPSDETADGEPSDEPSDIEPADGEPSDEPSDIEPADGEPSDEPSDIEPADGEPSDGPSDIEPADGDEEAGKGDVASPAQDVPADGEPSDETADETVDADTAEGESADADGEPTDAEPAGFTAGERVIEVNDGSVTLAWGPEAEIPEDVRVEVVEIERGTPDYDILYNNAMAALSEKKDTETTTQLMRFFDITLYDGDERFEPKAAISVTVKVNEAEATEDDNDVDAIHMEDVGAEATVVEATTDSDTVSFEAESFSIYGVVVDVPATEAEEPPVSVDVDLSSVDLMAAAEVSDTVTLSIPDLLAGEDEAVEVKGELGVEPEALLENAEITAPEGVQVEGDKLVLPTEALESGAVSLELTTYATNDDYETVATTHKVDIELSGYQGRTDVVEGDGVTVKAQEGNSLPADAIATAQQVEPAAGIPEDTGVGEPAAENNTDAAETAGDEAASPAQDETTSAGIADETPDADIADDADAVDAPSDETADEADAPADAENESNEASASDNIDATAETVSDTLSGAVAYDITITNANEDVISETGMVEVALRPENLNIYEGLPANAIVTGVTYTLIHEHEGETAELPVEVDVDEAGNVTEFRFQTDRFSTSTLHYTVDFYYGDYEFHIPGEGYILLSRLFEVLHIQADAAQAVNVEFTDPSLLAVYHVEEDVALSQVFAEVGSPRSRAAADGEVAAAPVDGEVEDVADDAGDELDQSGDEAPAEEAVGEAPAEEAAEDVILKAVDWVLVSLAPFKSHETLTITMADGTVYVIQVEDAQNYTYYVLTNDLDANHGYLTSTNPAWEGEKTFYTGTSLEWPRNSGYEVVQYPVYPHGRNGYHYVRWLKDDGTTPSVLGSDGNCLRGTTKTEGKNFIDHSGVSYIAYFAPDDAKLLVITPYDTSKGSVSASGSGFRLVNNNGNLPRYLYSTDNVTLTATSGWPRYFKGWYKPDGTCYSTSATLNANEITSDLVLTPVFEDSYRYSTIANEAGKGYFYINESYKGVDLTNLPSEGVPDEGLCSFKYPVYASSRDDNYEFVYWLRDDGVTPFTNLGEDGKQSVLRGFENQTDYNVLSRNTTYVAFFKPKGDYVVRLNNPSEGGSAGQSSANHGIRTVSDTFNTSNVLYWYYYVNADRPVIYANPSNDWEWMFDGWYNNGSELISTDRVFNVYDYVFGNQEGSHRDLNLTPVFRRMQGSFNVWFDGSNGIAGGDYARCNTFYSRNDGGLKGSNSVFRSYPFSGGQCTITMPSASEIGVVRPENYGYTDFDFKGWYDVYNNVYYKAGDTATLTSDTVFYADWGPASYDIGQDADLGYNLDTGNFIRTKVFDYNNLFNFPSISLDRSRSVIPSQQGSTWTDWNKEYWSMNGDNDDFIFMTTVSAQGRSLNPYGRNERNQDREASKDGNKYTAYVWQGMLTDELRDRLFSTTNDPYTNPGHTYVGSDDHLYGYDSNTGYYYFDSDLNAAAYNQSAHRFYVYNYTDSTNKSDASDKRDFLPFNYGNGRWYKEGEGQVNYWFGMTSEIDFFLPNPTGFTDASGKTGNRAVKGDEMIYKFAGDDDVWVYVDNQLVLDMGGIHGKVYGEINFSTGEWKIVGNDANKIDNYRTAVGGSNPATSNSIDYSPHDDDSYVLDSDNLYLDEGDHTLKIYYLERGASQSNCAIYFNLAPRYGMKLLKEDSETHAKLGGATFGVYADEACTLPANVWESRTKEKTNIFTTDTSGVNLGYAFCSGLVAGRTYYIKELSAPEGYPDVSEEVITLTLDSDGNPESVSSTADDSKWTMATAEAGSAGESTLKLTVKNRQLTSITARKIWAMIDGSQYTRDENCEVTVKLKRYQLTDEQDDGNSTLPEYSVRLVSRYFADEDGKPINDNSGSIEIRSISTNKITRGGSISFEISASGNTGIYSVAPQYGRLTGAGFSNYTEDKPFIVNGGKVSAAQFGAFTLSNIQRDTDIYVTYIGEAADADSLGGSIEITDITNGTGSSLKKVWDNTDFRAAQGKDDLQVTLRKPDWTYTWDELDSTYYYTVEEVSSSNSLSANPLLPALLTEIPAYVQTYSSDGLNSGTISVRNTLQALKVKLRKRDASDRKNVEKAEFKIYMKSETEQPGFTVGQQSVIEANVGHWLETITDGATTYTNTNTNYDTDKKVFVSDSYGRFYTGYLPLGTYYIYEVNAPEGYKKLEGPIVMVMTENGPQYQVPGKDPVDDVPLDNATHSFYNVYIDNDQVGALKITKTVQVNGQAPAAGNTQTNGVYEFTIDGVADTATAGIQRKARIAFEGGKVKRTQVDNGEWVEVTDANNTGYVVVPDLKPGNYTVTETEPTNGTELILATGGVEVSADKVVTVNIKGGKSYNGNKTEAQASFTNNASTTYVEVRKTWAPAVPNGAQAVVRLYSDAKQSSEPTPTATVSTQPTSAPTPTPSPSAEPTATPVVTRSVDVIVNWNDTPTGVTKVTATATRRSDNATVTADITWNGTAWKGTLEGMVVDETYDVRFDVTGNARASVTPVTITVTAQNDITTSGSIQAAETRDVPVSVSWTGTPASGASVTVTATNADDSNDTKTVMLSASEWSGTLSGLVADKAYTLTFAVNNDANARLIDAPSNLPTSVSSVAVNGEVKRSVPVSVSWTGTPASGASVTVTAIRTDDSSDTRTVTLSTSGWSGTLDNMIVGKQYGMTFTVNNDDNASIANSSVTYTVPATGSITAEGTVTTPTTRKIKVTITGSNGCDTSGMWVSIYAPTQSGWGDPVYNGADDTGAGSFEVTVPIDSTQYIVQVCNINRSTQVISPSGYVSDDSWNFVVYNNVTVSSGDYTLDVTVSPKQSATTSPSPSPSSSPSPSPTASGDTLSYTVSVNKWLKDSYIETGALDSASVVVNIKRNNEIVASATLNKDNNWTVTISGLVKGIQHQYYYETYGYSVDFTFSGSVTQVNDYVNGIQGENVTSTATICYSGSSASAISPFQLAANIFAPVAYADDGDIEPELQIVHTGDEPPTGIAPVDGYEAITLDGEVDENETTAWYYRWDDLPACNDDGSPIHYYVVELDAQALLEGVNAETVTATYTSATNNDGGQTVTIKNEPEWPKGALTVTKQVKINSADPNGSTLADGTYSFTITGPDYPSGTTRTITVENGVATSSIELTGLTPGEYTVTEDATTNGTTLTGRSGGTNDGQRGIKLTVKPNDTASANIAAFTNNIDTGNLSLTKHVSGKTGDTTPFSFEIQLTAPTGVSLADSYPATHTGDDTVESVSVSNTGLITGIQLQDGQTITITALPAGTTYSISETGSYTGFHQGAWTNQSGTIPANSNGSVQAVAASLTNVFTADGSTFFKADKNFVNGDLADKQFTFTLTQIEAIPTGADAAQPVTESSDNVKLLTPETKTTDLLGGQNQTVTFSTISFDQDDIGKSFYFMIEETEAGLDQDDIKDHVRYDTSKHYFTVTVTEADGHLVISQQAHAQGDDDDTAKFTNEKLGKLKLRKVVTVNGVDQTGGGEYHELVDGAYRFTIKGPNSTETVRDVWIVIENGSVKLMDFDSYDRDYYDEFGLWYQPKDITEISGGWATIDNLVKGDYTVLESAHGYKIEHGEEWGTDYNGWIGIGGEGFDQYIEGVALENVTGSDSVHGSITGSVSGGSITLTVDPDDEAGAEAQAAFTNERPYPGALKLKKIALVSGSEPTGQKCQFVDGAYDFSVTGPTSAPEEEQVTKYVRIFIFGGQMANYHVSDNRDELGTDWEDYDQSVTDRWVTIEGLQPGDYTIKELGAYAAKQTPQELMASTTPLENVVLSGIAGGNDDADLDEGTITVTVKAGDSAAAEATAQAAFTNIYWDGQLGLRKIVEAHTSYPVNGNQELFIGSRFDFTVVGPVDANGDPESDAITKYVRIYVVKDPVLKYKYEIKDASGQFEGAANATELTSWANPYVAITNLKYGDYIITESDDWSVPNAPEGTDVYLKSILVRDYEGVYDRGRIDRDAYTDMAHRSVRVTINADYSGHAVVTTFTNELAPNTATVQKIVADINDSKDTPTEQYAENPWYDSADYDIGDLVPYRVTGYLPQKFYRDPAVDHYWYQIVDEMYNLEFQASSAKMYAFVKGPTDEKGTWYDVSRYFTTYTTTALENNGTRVTTENVDLKTITVGDRVDQWDEAVDTHTVTYPYGTPKTTANQPIIPENIQYLQLRYMAKLMTTAAYGTAGNPNQAKLIYGAEGTAETDWDVNKVFTYRLSFTKQDENGEPLPGTTFRLYKKYQSYDATGKGLYAGTKTVGTTTYNVLSTTPSASGQSVATGTLSDYYIQVGPEQGGANVSLFTWDGIDDGSYMLEETGTPVGYKQLSEPVVFSIGAEHQLHADDPQLTQIKVPSSSDDPIRPDGYAGSAVKETGVVTIKSGATATGITNYPYPGIKVVKIDEETRGDANPTKLDGATFTLQKWNGTDYADYVPAKETTAQRTTVDGEATYDRVEPGEYKLQETGAPTGYNIVAEPVYFKVEENSSYTVTRYDSAVGTENRKDIARGVLAHSATMTLTTSQVSTFTFVVGNGPTELNLKKELSGTTPEDSNTKLFTFRVVLSGTGLAAGQTYALTSTDNKRGTNGDTRANTITLAAGTGDDEGKFVAEVKLLAGETVTIKKLPVGVEYTVSEIDNPDGYDETEASKEASKTGTIGSTAASVTVINEYSAEDKVTFKVSKTFVGAYTGEKTKTFTFRLEQVDGENSDVQATENVKLEEPATVTVTMRTGDTAQQVSFEDIPFTNLDDGVDFWFKLSEVAGTDTDVVYDDTVTRVKVHVEDNGDGTLTITKTPEPEEGASDASFKNVAKLDIRIAKVAKGTSTPLSGAVFKLTRDTGRTNEQGVKIWEAVTGQPLSGGLTTDTAEGREGYFTVNENITLLELIDGTYKFEEISSPSGYIITTKEPVIFTVQDGQVLRDESELSDGVVYEAKRAAVEADSDHEAQDAVEYDTFIIPNEPGARLPETGGMGTTTIYIAGASLLMLAVLGFIWLNRKRDDGTGI